MSEIGKIKVRKLDDLIKEQNENVSENCCENESVIEIESAPSLTPVKKKTRKPKLKTVATTSKKTKEIKCLAEQEESAVQQTATVRKAKTTAKKEPPANQLRIDKFFKSCSKSYCVKAEITTSAKKKIGSAKKPQTSTSKRSANGTVMRGRGRKRLFEDSSETATTIVSSDKTPPRSNCKQRVKSLRQTRATSKKLVMQQEISACIDLCSESDEEWGVLLRASQVRDEELTGHAISKSNAQTSAAKVNDSSLSIVCQSNSHSRSSDATSNKIKPPSVNDTKLNDSNLSIVCQSTSLSRTLNATSNKIKPPSVTDAASTKTKGRKTPRPCPAYKIVEGTSFAVDAFQYGAIEGVTHYFLTHFHADHYIGLTRKFAMPLYMSHITANLVRIFIPLDDSYMHELSLHEPQVIDGVEVTAIDANHCPGAVMLIFKFSTGKCILHTGDFRANADMESEPIFWNYDIHTIYLDTTYLSNKYAFRTQYESIDEAKEQIRQFRERYSDRNILFICGAYLIGKEKFWSALASEFQFKVWTEDKRRAALNAMQVEEYNQLLCDNPRQANFHVISIVKLNYLSLVDYFEPYSKQYDMLLAIRPSGWEKNSKPQFRNKINIVGIEYSEHSSHNELQRFVTFIKPIKVISTVPVGRDLCKTAEVPQKWYKYAKLFSMQRNYQPSITSYLKLNTRKNLLKATNITMQLAKSSVTNTPTKSCNTPTKSSITPTKTEAQIVADTKANCQRISPLDTLNGSAHLNCNDTDNEEPNALGKFCRTTETISTNHNTNIAKRLRIQNNTPADQNQQQQQNLNTKRSLLPSFDADDDWMS